MYGILGGLLELVNVLGGFVLWVLIGKAAWRTNKAGRWARVIAGGLPCGIALTIVYFLFVLSYSGKYDVAGIIAFCLIVSIIIAGLASVLEFIRQAIDKDKPDS